jgi:hypothetical protein
MCVRNASKMQLKRIASKDVFEMNACTDVFERTALKTIDVNVREASERWL